VEKNAEALQTHYKHFNDLETIKMTPRINVLLVWFWRFAGNLLTWLRLENCSMFVPQRHVVRPKYSHVIRLPYSQSAGYLNVDLWNSTHTTVVWHC